MAEFFSSYFLLFAVGIILIVFLFSMKNVTKKSKSGEFLEQARADSERAREHMLAVEQKLDRMIELLGVV